jgi:AraC-like DNA-binding protein
LKKFPNITSNSDETLLCFNGIPYAKYHVVKSSRDGQTGFLTENSFLFVIQGEKKFYLDNKIVSVDESQFLLIKRGVYTLSDLVPEGKEFQALMIFIPDNCLKNFFATFSTNHSPATIPQSLLLMPVNKMLKSFMSNYLFYFGKTEEYLEKVLILELNKLLLIVLSTRYKNKVSSFLHSLVSGILLDIDFVVRKHLFQPISVEDLADLSGRSLASFKREFYRLYGRPPKKWINHQRLGHAVNLLKTTKKNVTEIAYACGYENVSHFIKAFKKEYSVTPKTWSSKSAKF